MKLAIRDITVDPTIQIRQSNHEATIQRYEEAFDQLPPIDVFETPDGYLLADGFHRMAAAQRLNHTEIEATVRQGSRQDAAEYAVIANTRNGDPLTKEERDEGIRRLRQLHPDWTQRTIAEAMSVSQPTVKRVFDVDEVKRSVVTPDTRVSDSHYREISAAPKKDWEPLVKATERRGWSKDATAQAVRNLKDDRISAERKREILEGEADPVVVTEDGQMAVPPEIAGKRLREMASNDAVLAMERALEALAKLRLYRPEAIINTIGQPRLSRLINEMPGYIEFMEEIVAAAEKGQRPEAVA